jgi:L-fuculose-phosphate aldolase
MAVDAGLEAARDAVVAAGARLDRAGLAPGTSGNVSVREGDLVALSPSGLGLGRLRREDVPITDLDGHVVAGSMRPTSELPLHLAIYRATDAKAVAHAHALVSTAVSCTAGELPPIHYNVVVLGGPVRVAPYATFGSEELAANVVAVLRTGRSAALMQNHGSLATGATLDEAGDRLELLEWLCQVHLHVASLGSARVLSDEELDAVRATLASDRYGQPD